MPLPDPDPAPPQPLVVRLALTLLSSAALALLAIPSLPGIRPPVVHPRPPAPAPPRPAPLAPVEGLADLRLELDGRTFVPGAFALREGLPGGVHALRGVWIDAADPALGLRLDLSDESGVLSGLGAWAGRSWRVDGRDGVLGLDALEGAGGDGPAADLRLVRAAGSAVLEPDGALAGAELEPGLEGDWVLESGRWSAASDGRLVATLVAVDGSDPSRRWLGELHASAGATTGDLLLRGLDRLDGLFAWLPGNLERQGEALVLAGELEVQATPRGFDAGSRSIEAGSRAPARLVLHPVRGSRGSLTAAVPDPRHTRTLTTSLLALEGVSRCLLPRGEVLFEELPEGHARLRGSLQDAVDRTRGFELELLFLGRVAPTSLAALSQSGELLELAPTSYAEGGGPVDPRLWSHYEEVRGVLIGTGSLEGARVELRSLAPAQVGFGADGVSLGHGLLAALRGTVAARPRAGFPEGTVGAVLRARLGR